MGLVRRVGVQQTRTTTTNIVSLARSCGLGFACSEITFNGLKCVMMRAYVCIYVCVCVGGGR